MAALRALTALIGISAVIAGGVWPAPQHSQLSGNATVFLAPDFAFDSVGADSDVLAAAFKRYSALLRLGARNAVPLPATADAAPLASLSVAVASADASLAFGVDESYSLAFNGSAAAPAATLSAPTVWGALRGLETFAQLAETDSAAHAAPLQVPAPPATISDAPRFAYRGLMIDVARHFYPLSFIEEHILAAMEASKLNVLHVHLTDDQSFPVASAAFPELAAKGAFGPAYVYSAADLERLVASATARGIHLVPEFDMPAHTSRWGAGHPEIMVNDSAGCSPRPGAHGDTMDPSSDQTFALVDGLLGEMAGGPFRGSEFLHLGGDEVPELCWLGSPRVRAFMKAQGIGSANELESYFVNRVAAGKALVAANKTLVYWEEIFNNNVSLPATALIQAWKTNAMPAVVAAGHRTTNSYKWYLNHGCNNYGDGTWEEFYLNDPLTWLNPGATPAEQALVVGGETTMWAECVDATIFDAIVWPRAAAAAEQLWSPRAATRSTKSVELGRRLSEHRCRLVGRGIGAAPIDDSAYPLDYNQGCQ